MLHLLDLMYEDAKEAMVSAEHQRLPLVQARALAIQHIRNKITQPNLPELQARFNTSQET